MTAVATGLCANTASRAPVAKGRVVWAFRHWWWWCMLGERGKEIGSPTQRRERLLQRGSLVEARGYVAVPCVCAMLCHPFQCATVSRRELLIQV